MNHELIKKTNELQKQLLQALRTRNYVRANAIQRQLNKLQYEECSLQRAALESLTEAEHIKAVTAMNKLFFLGDLIEDAATDLEGCMLKANVQNINICEWATEIKKISSKFAKTVDSYQDEGFSEVFGDLCDEIKEIINGAYAKFEENVNNNVRNSRREHELANA